MEMCIARMHSSNKLYGSGFMMLSTNLYSIFIKYIQEGRIRAPPAKDLSELAPTFQSGAKTDRRALQSKFKSWAKRMALIDSHLVMANTGKYILPREQCESIIRKIHFQNVDSHLSFEEVMVEIQKTYTWNRKNFGMDWNIVASTLAVICGQESCLTGLQKQYFGSPNMRNLNISHGGESSSYSLPSDYSSYSVSQVTKSQSSPAIQKYMIKFPANYQKSSVIAKLLASGEYVNAENSLKPSSKDSPKTKFLKKLSLMKCNDKTSKKRKNSNSHDESIIPQYLFASPDSNTRSCLSLGFNDTKKLKLNSILTQSALPYKPNNSNSFNSSNYSVEKKQDDRFIEQRKLTGENSKDFVKHIKRSDYLSSALCAGMPTFVDNSKTSTKTELYNASMSIPPEVWNQSLNLWKLTLQQKSENSANSSMAWSKLYSNLNNVIPWDKLPSKTYLKDNKLESLSPSSGNDNISAFGKTGTLCDAEQTLSAYFNWIPQNQFAKILNPNAYSSRMFPMTKVDSPYPGTKLSRTPTTLWRPDPEAMGDVNADNKDGTETRNADSKLQDKEALDSVNSNIVHKTFTSAVENYAIKRKKFFWEDATTLKPTFYDTSKIKLEPYSDSLFAKNGERSNDLVPEKYQEINTKKVALSEENIYEKMEIIWALCNEMHFDFKQYFLSITVEDDEGSSLYDLQRKIDEALLMIKRISEDSKQNGK